MSTPPAPLSPNSRVYTSPSQPAHPSFLSSSPLSHTTSRTPDSPDSLRSASPSEVESRALEFLSSSAVPSLALDPHSFAALREAGAIDPLDLPRKIPSTEAGRKEAQDAAVDFLRRALDGVEETCWMYHTPAPFDQPQPLAPRGGAASSHADHHISLDDGLPQRDANWADRAFNLEAYADPTAGMSGHVSEVVQRRAGEEEEEGGEGEWAEDDGEPDHTIDNTFDNGAGNGMVDGVGERRRGRTGGLVRGVSDLAMK